MLGSQILFIISTTMVTVGVMLKNIYGEMPESANRLFDYENAGMIASSALLVSIGSVLLLASLAMIYLKPAKTLSD